MAFPGDTTMWDGRTIRLADFLGHLPERPDLDECWPWYRLHHGNGYGTYGRFTARAHQVMFWLAHRRRPDSEVMHICHNRACVNPLHLGEGSRKDNARQSIAIGRYANQKLDGADRERVRILYATGDLSQEELGRLFGVHQATISKIVLAA